MKQLLREVGYRGYWHILFNSESNFSSESEELLQIWREPDESRRSNDVRVQAAALSAYCSNEQNLEALVHQETLQAAAELLSGDSKQAVMELRSNKSFRPSRKSQRKPSTGAREGFIAALVGILSLDQSADRAKSQVSVKLRKQA